MFVLFNKEVLGFLENSHVVLFCQLLCVLIYKARFDVSTSSQRCAKIRTINNHNGTKKKKNRPHTGLHAYMHEKLYQHTLVVSCDPNIQPCFRNDAYTSERYLAPAES